MVLHDLAEQGVTRLRTRRQRLRRALRVLTALVGAAVSVSAGAGITSILTGRGWAKPSIRWRAPIVGHLVGVSGKDAVHLRVPVTVTFTVPLVWAAVAAAPVWSLWLLLQVLAARRRRHPGPDRHRGLATPAAIRGKYGAGAVRRAGVFTLPDTTRWQRLLLPTSSFGYRFGHPLRPQARRTRLWFNFETRLRIVARTGWGKSWRLLIPLIRTLPGPAVITSVEPEIFTATVTARARRLPPVRFRWLRLLRPCWRTPTRYPVVVADLSELSTRMAAGFPQVRWNPIVGSENFKVATTRAKALVSGGDADNDTDTATDKFFRDSATQVLAAWLHAAALDPRKDIEDLVEWLRDTDLNTPTSVLQTQTGPELAAAQTAIMNMTVHLDPAAGRTTSGVRRYLNFAISSLASGPGRALCGDRHQPQFDMHQLIESGGTVYLLAEVDEMELARPLLTLFAQEMFLAAERVARQQPGRRLPHTFMGVFDELHAGVRMPILPYVATVQRKYGISYAYAIQSSTDEEQMYGRAGAGRLRAQAHTIIGGYDADTAQETTRRAGRTPVVIATKGAKSQRTEQVHDQDVLPESDQQQLKDGDSIILGPGILPFLAHTHRVDHHRKAERQIRLAIHEVEEHVTRRRDTDHLVAAAHAARTTGRIELTLTKEPA